MLLPIFPETFNDMKNSLLVMVCSLLLLASCKNTDKGKDDGTAAVIESTPFDYTDSGTAAFGKTILALLKEKDYKGFAAHIHPDEGIIFAPYGYIDTADNRKFSQASFLAMINNPGKLSINWGKFDGSGLPMELTWEEYASRFVYNADFLHAPEYSVNSIKGRGNSLNNIDSVFRNNQYTESYFPGFEEKYGGLDWTALRLVFKAKDGKLYVVGVVHDQWTS